mmetsp:Transcript_57868/g.64730  ORF Transcript_57868/g.64730 Transcript_57868/m.64730 type:complete len:250 (-) Transcript_57868:129-878(-)
MVTIKFLPLGVITTHVMVVTVLLLVASSARVDAFSSGVAVNQRTRTRIRIRAGRQPSASLLPPLAYLMREGDDEFGNDGNNSNSESAMKMKTTTIVPSTINPTFTGTSTDTTINLVDEKMIDDLQNQYDEHLQMMQHEQQHDRVQQQQQQQSLLLSYSVTDPLLPTILFPSTAAPTTAVSLLMTMMSSTTTTKTITANKNVVGMHVGTYDKLHEDLKHLNMRLLLHRWFPHTKKQHIERLVHLLIKYIL